MAASLHLPADVESLTAEQVLALVLEELPGRVALACSFQKEESVLLDMLFALEPNGARLRHRHAPPLPGDVRVLARVEERYGTTSWRCSRAGGRGRALGDEARAVPLDRKGRAARTRARRPRRWITGVRRDQSPTRADAPKLGWDDAHELWKANPLADWSGERLLGVHPRARPARTTRCTTRATSRSATPIRRSRARARGPLGRHGPARVRHPHRGRRTRLAT